MKNPITQIKIPGFRDYPKEFSELYNIKIVEKLDYSKEFNSKEFHGYGQEYKNACLMACLRSVLYNDFNIKFSHEYDLINLATDIDKTKARISGKNYNYEKNNIKKQGAYLKHVKNIADFFRIGAFSSNNSSITELKKIIDTGINPIVFRTINEKDVDGHYVVVYGYENEIINFFDPAYRGKRPKDNVPHKGTYKNETISDFLSRWSNEYFYGGYIFLYHKNERPKIKLKGNYL
ncbi:MAG: C39 family peptidase [Candidatus Woesearchaeota archaeon]